MRSREAGDWCALKIAAHEHPNISEQRVVIRGGLGAGLAGADRGGIRARESIDTAFVDGEFPTEGSIDLLLEAAWVDAAFDRHQTGTGLALSPLPVAALDVARSVAGDESACPIARRARPRLASSLTAWRSC